MRSITELLFLISSVFKIQLNNFEESTILKNLSNNKNDPAVPKLNQGLGNLRLISQQIQTHLLLKIPSAGELNHLAIANPKIKLLVKFLALYKHFLKEVLIPN